MPPEGTQRVLMNLPTDMVAALDAAARETGVDRTALIRHAVQLMLDPREGIYQQLANAPRNYPETEKRWNIIRTALFFGVSNEAICDLTGETEIEHITGNGPEADHTVLEVLHDGEWIPVAWTRVQDDYSYYEGAPYYLGGFDLPAGTVWRVRDPDGGIRDGAELVRERMRAMARRAAVDVRIPPEERDPRRRTKPRRGSRRNSRAKATE